MVALAVRERRTGGRALRPSSRHCWCRWPRLDVLSLLRGIRQDPLIGRLYETRLALVKPREVG